MGFDALDRVAQRRQQRGGAGIRVAPGLQVGDVTFGFGGGRASSEGTAHPECGQQGTQQEADGKPDQEWENVHGLTVADGTDNRRQA